MHAILEANALTDILIASICFNLRKSHKIFVVTELESPDFRVIKIFERTYKKC